MLRLSLVLLACAACLAADTATLRGIVHDPQHRPIPGAQIAIHGGSVTRNLVSDANGEFQVDVPQGQYAVNVSAPGFQAIESHVSVAAGKSPVQHFQLALAVMSTSVEVSGAVSRLSTQESTVQTAVTPREITQTAGADQSNSMAMITNFTPGASMVHDMLHVRGGHQVNWFFDGIPVINTNIAANVAPLINPKNVDELEVERGGFSSEYGDRTYGFFNVVTPSGFERHNEIGLVLSGGNFFSTDDQLSIASHTDRFAYYASVDGSRSQLGLSTPVPQVIHDQTSAVGAFVSLLFNASPNDQLRWIGSVREDHYQIPNDPDAQAAGIRDLDLERDNLVGFHWMHSFAPAITLAVSPYYHYNDAHYIGGPQDQPFVLDDNGRSHYAGARSVLQVEKGKHSARVGLEFWAQHDDTFFALTANPGAAVLDQRETHWANSTALFAEDHYKLTKWLDLDVGIRYTHYHGLVDENAATPRLGGAIRIPGLNWTIHGYYAYYYQPPPLDSLAGPSLDFALAQGFGFIPLAGERDIQHDIGLSIPIRGWSIDTDNFHTSARNFLDHDVIGDSGIFIPLTDLGAVISGTEVTLRSPRLFRVAQWRVAYSNQIAQGIGPITGGLLEDAPAGNFLLDHDQRNTLSSVLSLNLPHQIWMTPAYQFGSGFLNGNGPAHLPPHSTFDLSIGKHFGDSYTVSANAVNIGNSRYLLDTSNTFGGTHFVNPRQIYGEVRIKLHW